MSTETENDKDQNISITISEFEDSGITITTDGTECYRISIIPDLNSVSE
jgi:hypothetical protein